MNTTQLNFINYKIETLKAQLEAENNLFEKYRKMGNDMGADLRMVAICWIENQISTLEEILTKV